jgi:hypothetical protein
MLTQTINFLASARPNLGAAGQGQCTPAAGGGAPIGVGEDNCEAPLLAGRGNDAQDGRATRRAARGCDGGAPEVGEDGAGEEDGEEADARSMGIREPRRPGLVGEEATGVPGADGGRPAAWRGTRASTDFGRLAAAVNPVGQRMRGATKGGGRGG